MKTNFQVVAIIGIVGLWSFASSYAATNVVMVANFSLSGIKQSGDRIASVRMTSKDIIAALNNTGRFNFGSTAKIVFVSQEDQLPRMAVREGTGVDTTTTDISAYLTITETGEEIRGPNNLTSYVVQTFSFNDRNGTTFRVRGVTTLHRGTITGPGIGPLSRVKTSSESVNGDGNVDGADAMFHGTVTGGSAKAEAD